MIVYIDYNDQVRLELNVPFLSRTTDAHAASVSWEDLMPRFYFDLASNDEHMIDAGRKDPQMIVQFAVCDVLPRA